MLRPIATGSFKSRKGRYARTMRNTEPTDNQWVNLAPLLPARRPQVRPRTDDRKTIDGILYVLRTVCRWQDVPQKYGSPTTCWRRLKTWDDVGTLVKVWRSLLALLDEREKSRLGRAFLVGTFIPARRGTRR